MACDIAIHRYRIRYRYDVILLTISHCSIQVVCYVFAIAYDFAVRYRKRYRIRYCNDAISHAIVSHCDIVFDKPCDITIQYPMLCI